jgi:hypothetical protein
VEGGGRVLIFRYCPDIRVELKKITKKLSQDSLSPGRDLNPGPPEHEARVLITRPRRSVEESIWEPGRRWEYNIKNILN